MNICFDVDGCLIDKKPLPIKSNIELLKVLSKDHKIYIWSGNGWSYAYETMVDLGLEDYIQGVLNKYNTFVPDVAFDDQEIDLGRVNIKV